MNNEYIFYFLCLIVIMSLLYVLHLANKRDANWFNSNRYLPIPTQTILQKHNCDVETIYSFNDEQCNSVCLNIGSYISKNGICVNVLAFSTSEVIDTCDPKRGVLAYLIGNTQFGSLKLRCLTIDDGIQPSDTEKPNIICQNGQISIDYLKSYPQLENCKCSDNQVLAIVSNTNSIRSHGICVKETFKNFWDYNSLLFTKDTV